MTAALSVQSNGGMSLQRVLAALVGAFHFEVDQLLAVRLALARDLAAHGDYVADPGYRGETRAEAANLLLRHPRGDEAAEEGHRQHAVREHVLETELLGEVEIDVDRIVVARAAAIERELVAADRRQDERLQGVANLDVCELRCGCGCHGCLLTSCRRRDCARRSRPCPWPLFCPSGPSSPS